MRFLSRPIRFTLLVIMSLMGGGCAAKIPTYPWQGTGPALQIITDRVAQMDTFTAEGTLVLEKEAGRPVVLDAVVVGQAPDRLRLRAWKFNQAVFDLIVNEEGTWLWTSDRVEDDQQLHFLARRSARHVLSPWWWLGASLSGDQVTVIREDAQRFEVRRPFADDMQVLVEAAIDKATCTVRQYILTDESRRTRQTIELAKYRAYDDIVWPTRMQADGEQGRIILRLDHVDVNEPPPPTAFIPPRRARRIESGQTDS